MTETASPVVIATPSDEDDLLDHCRLHYAENRALGATADVFPFDDDEARALLRRAFAGDKVIVGIIRDGERLAASIGLVLSKMWFTRRWHLDEVWTYVHPDFRKSSHARDLSAFATNVRRKLGAPLIAGVVTSPDTESKLRLYQRRYGNPIGAIFIGADADERPKPNGSVIFWDNPFPRPGVAVVSTHGLSQKDLDKLSQWKKRDAHG